MEIRKVFQTDALHKRMKEELLGKTSNPFIIFIDTVENALNEYF